MRHIAIGITEDDGETIQLYNGQVLTKEEFEEIQQKANVIVLGDDDASLAGTTDYRLVMQTIVNRIEYMLEFDTITSISVSSTSELTEHPLVNGDILADHMYRHPASMTITGKFSLQGNKRYSYEGAAERLANIQSLFEQIKNEGVLSKLVTIKGTETSSLRFKERRNMALTSIQWNEYFNSMDFSLTFNEVIVAGGSGGSYGGTGQGYGSAEDTNYDGFGYGDIEYSVDVTDPNLPAITDATSLDFTDTLIDWNSIDETVIRQLISAELLTADFLNYAVDAAKSYALGSLTGLAIGTGAALIGLQVLLAIFGTCASIPVYGWIALAAIVATCVIACGIIALVKSIKRSNAASKYKTKQFKLYKDDRKNQQEVERFCNYLGNIHTNLEYLEDVMQVYGITSNEAQECLTYIDDNYYIFRFTQNNVSKNWSLTVLDIENNVKGSIPNVESGALADISQCTSSNMIFRTPGSGFYVYLVNKGTNAELNNGADQKALNKQGHDLTNYCILVAQTNMDEFNAMLKDIILDAMTR